MLMFVDMGEGGLETPLNWLHNIGLFPSQKNKKEPPILFFNDILIDIFINS